MQKIVSRLIIFLSYIATIFFAVNLTLLFPKYTLIIIGGLVIVAIALACIFNRFHRRDNQRMREAARTDLHIVAESINAMAIVWDDNFRKVKVNSVFQKTLGYSSAEMHIMRNLKKVLPPDAFAPSLQGIINTREEEFIVTAKDGRKIQTIWNTSLMKKINEDDRETFIMLSIGFDLSENTKLREEILKFSKELEDSENMFALSMQFSEIGLVMKDENGFYLSEQFRKMVDFPAGMELREALESVVHPKDVKIVDLVVSEMTNMENNADEIKNVELRLRRQDNLYHWFQFRYKVTPNKDYQKANVGGAVIDITNDKEKDRLIEQMAYIDEITELYNRNRFLMLGQEVFDLAHKELGNDYWIIVFDIDSFHIINDTCGYWGGNRILKEFANILLFAVVEDGVSARIGGDNFAIIVEDCGSDDQPLKIIKKVQKSLGKLSIENFSNQSLTCSAGYSKMSDGKRNFIQGLEHAEFSLSLSDGTRGNVTRYNNKIHETILENSQMEKDLALALENGELVLYYQPKINLANGELIGMEGLIRWIKPNGIIVPPSQFIPVAEHSMLITEISEFVLKEACRQNKIWQDKGYCKVTVSINLSAIDFYQTNVIETIEETLSETGLEAQYLDLELTESLALKDIEHAIRQMEEIKSLGVKLSMDDFGTGYSSLSYIQVLPITLLKLDRSFVMYLEEDEVSREILSAVIKIAKSKKIETIAEGIETLGQADILRNSGCDHAQGYFFGKPMPAAEFEEFIKKKLVDKDCVAVSNES